MELEAQGTLKGGQCPLAARSQVLGQAEWVFFFKCHYKSSRIWMDCAGVR
jgi:hypothetical protein